MTSRSLDRAEEDPRGTAARILDAAEEVFAESGFAGASTREIAARARVPFGALHYHWGSKRELWRAVFQRLGERMQETLLRNLAPGTTLADIVDNVTDAFIEMLVRSRNAARLALRAILEPADPEVERMFDGLAELGLGLFRDLAPGREIDGKVTLFILSTAFLAVVVDETGQRSCLGDSVFVSRPARERLRAELRRLALAMLKIEA
jgi:AcrR family transcriptional regulator